jgi:hypothetical protein
MVRGIVGVSGISGVDIIEDSALKREIKESGVPATLSKTSCPDAAVWSLNSSGYVEGTPLDDGGVNGDMDKSESELAKRWKSEVRLSNGVLNRNRGIVD